jgi:hypothetical protein
VLFGEKNNQKAESKNYMEMKWGLCLLSYRNLRVGLLLLLLVANFHLPASEAFQT